MKTRRQLFQFLLWTASVWVLVINSTKGEGVQPSKEPKKTNANLTQQLSLWSGTQPVELTKEIRLVQTPTPSSQSVNQVITVTSVKANGTNRAVEVILETPKGRFAGLRFWTGF